MLQDGTISNWWDIVSSPLRAISGVLLSKREEVGCGVRKAMGLRGNEK